MAKVAVRHFPVDKESVLHSMFNLECERGHKFYSPEPMSQVGHHCTMKLDGGTGGRCNARIMFLRASRKVNPKKKPSKLKKMKRF